MKRILPLILSTLLLTSCSGPDSSGGVEFSKTDNAFPYGDCRGSGYQTHITEKTGCGWITVDEKNYYIKPYAKLRDADLRDAILIGANLSSADLEGARLRDADLRGAFLNDADLWDADLRDANLNWANLTHAILTHADLSYANLTHANLRDADLRGADLRGVEANSRTICPNGKKWGTAGNDCPF